MRYTPPKKILENYANVMVNFALGKGKGIKKDDVVLIHASEVVKPLYVELLKAVRKAGGHVISQYAPDNESWYRFDREFYQNSTAEQLNFFPSNMIKGQVEDVDHYLYVWGETDVHSMQGIDAKKIMQRGKAWEAFRKWRDEKENQGRLSWSATLYGTKEMAKEAGLTEKEYWNQIIKACFLDAKNPIAEWKKVAKQISLYQKKLDDLKIEKVHIQGPDVDLWVKIGANRKWMAGNGANIPSFEIFTTPDWRGTEGWIKFNQPLYIYGNLMTGVELTFKDGKVVKSKATKNEKVLKAMIATDGADRIGEFSLTDRRFSRITKFMAETLYDENVGGPNGNTHIALGNAYKECLRGDISKVTEAEWKKLGFNDSSVHTDIISTAPRTVTAYLAHEKTKIIYKNGQFTL